MSFIERMNSIESRMSQLDAQLDSGNGMRQASMGGGTSSPARPVPGAGGPSFENILNTVSADKKFRPTGSAGPVSTWKGDPKDFDGMIADAAKTQGVDESLIRAVIRQESAFNPKATSGCGAKGMMQLMDDTAKELGVSNSYDPHQNIMGGAKYLKQLLTRFDGNMTKAIAGYNAGPGAVEKYGGLPPFGETQDYVTKVMGYYQSYKGQRA